MKVLIATGLYPPEIGGPATYVKMLEESLPGQDITLTVLPFTAVRKYPKGIRHVVYAWNIFRSAKQADVIYALDAVSVGLPAALVAGLVRKPFLVRLGGDYAWEQGKLRFGVKESLDDFAGAKKSSLILKLLVAIQNFVCARAKGIIVPSQYLKKIVTTWGIPEQKIKVIYSALSPIVVSESKSQLREQLQYRHPTIISAARLVPWKGFSVLLDVITELKKRFPEIVCVIAGEGEEKEHLIQKSKELDIEENVRLVGRLSKSDLGIAIKAADVFVLNTAYEGLSHQLLEVMSLETPIVATNIGGNPELLTHNENGLLVSYNNQTELLGAITTLIENDEYRNNLVTNALNRTKDFSKEVSVSTTAEYLRSFKKLYL